MTFIAYAPALRLAPLAAARENALLGKMQVNLLLLSLNRTLALPKILTLGKMQVNLLLPSLNRIFVREND